MIRRSVRARFHTVYWRPPTAKIEAPAVFYANHHGWMDGYLMFHLVDRLGLPSLDWIEEFDAFPLFAKVGGLRFPKGDAAGRAATVRTTIRLMREGRSLILFAEGTLHRPPEVWELGKSLSVIARHVEGVSLVPVALYQEMSLHERPEAFIGVGAPHAFDSLQDCRARLSGELANLRSAVAEGRPFDVLARGTPDVNERWDMRRFRR